MKRAACAGGRTAALLHQALARLAAGTLEPGHRRAGLVSTACGPAVSATHYECWGYMMCGVCCAVVGVVPPAQQQVLARCGWAQRHGVLLAARPMAASWLGCPSLWCCCVCCRYVPVFLSERWRLLPAVLLISRLKFAASLTSVQAGVRR